jgi:hypothetical protein
MPLYRITAPNGQTYQIEGPPGASDADVARAVLAQNPEAGSAPAAPKESTIGSELVRGAKQVVSSARTGAESLFDKNKAATEGVARSQAIGQEAGEGASFEALQKAYEKEGLLGAAKELPSQVSRGLAGQAANIATAVAGSKAGAAAGAPFGMKGRIVGGAAGAASALLPQFMGQTVQTQASEQMEQGKPVDIDRTKAYTAAAGMAALEGAGTAFTLGKRVVKGILGIADDAALVTAKSQAELVKAAERSLAASVGRGVTRGTAEIPVEVGQEIIDRYQSGQDLTSPEAIKAYGEAAYMATLVGGTVGGVSGPLERSQARNQVEQQKRAEEAARPAPPAPEPEPEIVPGAKLREDAPVGKQGTLFTPREMGQKIPETKKQPAPEPETFNEVTAERDRLQAQEQTPEVRAQLDKLKTKLAPKGEEQQTLGLDYQRDYADLATERDALRAGPRTAEARTRIAELSEQMASYDEATTGQRQAEEAIKAERDAKKAKKAVVEPPVAAPVVTGITQADIDAIGLPLRTSKQWVTDNVLGKTVEELQALVQREPNLINNKGARAEVLKALIAPQPTAFEEKPNVPTTTQTDQPQGELDLGRGKPSVGVSGKPASTDVVQPGTGVSTATGTSATPDGLGLAPTGQPTGKRTKAKGTTAPAVTPNAPVTPTSTPSPAAPAAPVAGPPKTTKRATKITPPKEDKAPPTPKAAEPVKSRYERLLDISNNESIPVATRKQAEKQMDLLDDPTMNKSKADRKGNEDYADKFLTRIEGLKSVAIADGQSLDALKDEIKNAKGVLGTALRRMVQSGKVVLEDAHPSGKKLGGFYDGEKVTLYANGIPSGQSIAVALHEVGAHLGMRNLLGKKQYNAVIDRILDMVAKADGSIEAKIAQLAYKRIPVSDFKRGVGRDEMVAYFVEEMAKAEADGTLPKIGPMRVMWNQIKTAIVTSINKALGTSFGVKDFSAQDIFDIAKSSFIAESETAPTKGEKVDMASTSQFQKWFGDSKVVDKNGKPLVVYRGVIGEDEKALNAEPRAGYAAFGSDSPQVAASYGNPDLEWNETGAITPLYIKADKLIEFPSSNGKFDKFAFDRRAKTLSPGEVLVARQVYDYGPRANTKVDPAKLYSYPSDVYAWGKGTSVKSATGNRGTYDIDNPKILFSTSYTPQDVVNGLGPLTPLNERSVKQMVFGMQTESDPSFGTRFRVATVDSAAALEEKFSRTFNGAVRNALGKINPMGLYRQAQDYSKILGEYFQNGTLVKDKDTGLYRTVGKGEGAPIDVFPLIYAWGAKTGRTDKEAEQFASRVLEAKRLDEVLKVNPDFPKHLTDRDRAVLIAEYNSDPVFAQMSAAMDKPRLALIDKMVEVGRLSKETATEWKSVIGYVPFDRIEDFTDKFSTVKKTTGRSPLALTKDPELVGSFKRPVGNVFENYLNTMGWMVGQVMNNDARVQTLTGLQELGFTKAPARMPGTENRSAKAYVNGELRYWELPSRYDVAAFQDLNPPKMALMRTLGTFSNILRKSVTLLPPFALKQVTDDVQRAMLTSGVKSPTALLRMTLANFGSLAWAELRGIQHPIVKEFGALGLTGEYDFEAGKPAISVLKDLGYRERTVAGSKLLGTLLHRLDGITRASDLAVRKAIYDQTMIENNKDQLLAQSRAREFINFRRRGSSEAIAIATATIPFFNAYVQGMDVLYRAASGNDSSSSVGRAQARQLFWSRAGTVAMLSTMYALMSGDDEDYQDMDLRTRNSNWILPGGYKIPVPGELGALFKVIPETVMEYLRRSGTPEEQTALEAIRSAAAYMAEQYIGRTVPIPQAVKPLIEAWTNYSFFTGRELEGIYQKQQDPSMRVTSKTSELAQAISNFSRDVIGVDAVSPIQIDNMLSGYFGSTAALVTMVTDSLLNPSRVDRPLHKYALLSNYMHDPVGTRRLTEFYDEREKVGKANNTLRQLMKTDIARAETYAESHQTELMLESAVNSTLEQLERTRAYRKFLNSPDGAADMSKDDREKELEEIKKMEVEFTRWVREAKTELRKTQ